MKKYTIMLVALILALLTIGAVNASDDNNLTSDTLELEDDPQDVLFEDDNRIDADYYYGHIPDEIYETDQPDIWVCFESEDVSGSIAVQINGKEVVNHTATYDENYIYYDEYASELEYNKLYNLSLLYSGDTKYLPFNKTSQITLNYIKYDSFEDMSIDASQWVSASLPEDAEGEVSLLIDGALYGTEDVEDGAAYFWMTDLTYGNHTYEFRYSGDKKYPKSNKKGVFEATYTLDFDLNDGDTFQWGNEILLEIDTPGGVSSKLTLNINDIIKEIALDEYGRATYILTDLKYGQNTLTFTYDGDSTHPKRSVTKHINVIENMEFPEQVRYSSNDNLTIKLPNDANGNIIISENETIISSSPLKNGEISIPLSTLPIGPHYLYVNYTGNDYEIEYPSISFEVIPYVVYDKSISINEDNSISLILPENGEGYFIVKNKGKILGNQTIINGKSKINLNNLEIGEYQEFTVMCEGNYDYITEISINVRNTPRDTPIIMYVGEKIVTSSESVKTFEFNSFAQGYINITINNRTTKVEVNEGEAHIYTPNLIENLTLGKYTLEVSYSGDEYYNPSHNQTTFELTYINLNIPSKIIINQNDYLYIPVANDLTGEIALYINGKLYKKSVPDEEVDFIEVIDLSELELGEYKNVELKFSGDSKYPKASQKGSFNVTYLLDVICEESSYGYPAEVLIEINANYNGICNVNINGRDYQVTISKGSGKLEINDLDIGEHNVTVTCQGDSNLPKNTEMAVLTIIPKIQYHDIYITENNSINLTLPSNANGNLTVEIFDKNDETVIYINENVKLNNGFATIPINNLKLGSYNIKATYTGTDYNVEPVDSMIIIKPFINEFDFEIGKENTITFKMPNDANGVLTVEIDDWEDILFNETIYLNNGTAKISLADYPANIYSLNLIYNDSKYGNFETSASFVILKHTPTIKVAIPKEIIAKDTTTIKFTVPKDAKGTVWVSFDDDYYTGTVKNGEANVKIKPQKSGYKLMSYGFEEDEKYCSWSDSTYIRILKTPTIKANDLKMYYYDGSYFKATIYDSFGKLVSGKYVDFYIGSKKIKSVKTDKKGIAKIKITQVPKTYKITVKYRGASLTKKITVKQILTLKTVKVKKSAKKLVLTATLKKGKKAIKGKKITFKFKGKKYTAKTNKKGIAKVTIKKTVLKKLKVGKKLTYQATYVKDTVKKTVKIKK